MHETMMHADIEALLPHKGGMCLLERVLQFDAESVTCASSTHRSADNPLRTERGLASATAIEYGAQAAALHRGLLAKQSGHRQIGKGAAPRRGLLVQVREVKLHMQRLDTLAHDLCVRAWRSAEVGEAVQYRFEVSAFCGTAGDEENFANNTRVAEGELLVVLS